MARDLRLFYLFRLLATSYLFVPIFWHFQLSRGLDSGDVTILLGIYSLTVILVEIPTGALADRIGRRESMMAGALCMVASCLVAYNAHSFAVFVVAEVLAATSMALCSGADSAYLFDLLHTHGRGEEYARSEGTGSAAHLAGMAIAFLAGGLLGEVNLALPYLATAVVAGIAFLIACFMKNDRARTVASKPRPVGAEFKTYGSHMAKALGAAMRSRRLLWLMAYSAALFVLLKATVYLYQPYLKERGIGIAETGFIFSMVYLVAAVVARHSDGLRRRVGERTVVWGLLATLSISFVLLNQLPGGWALCILGVQAVAKGLYSPLVKLLLNREIADSSRRATMLSIESIVRRGAFGLFSPALGFVAATSAIYACGAFGLVAIILLALTSKGRLRPNSAIDSAASAMDSGQVVAE